MQRSTRVFAAAAVAVLMAAGPSLAGRRTKVELTPSAQVPRAKGRAVVSLRSPSDGRFAISVRRLEGETSYDLVVGGIKVATIETNRGGSGKLKFSTRPRRSDLLLGFDPRGEAIEVRHPSGDDVLAGNMPATAGDDAEVACCLPDGGGDGPLECEDRTADECVAAGGALAGPGTCLPDPCGATPPADTAVVCCIPDDSGPECEDRTAAQCAAEGGTSLGAGVCPAVDPCGDGSGSGGGGSGSGGGGGN